MKRQRAFSYLWAEHRTAMVAAILALAVIVFFTLKLAFSTIYWADPAHRNQTVSHWMTPSYIANSHQIDPDILREAIGPVSLSRRRATLDAIAAARNEPVEAVIARIEAAIAALGDAPVMRE